VKNVFTKGVGYKGSGGNMKHLLTLTLLILGAAAWAEHPHYHHGFVVLGDETFFLYHLAKFDSPHRYQGLFEVTVKDSTGADVSLKKLRESLPRHTVVSLVSNSSLEIPDLDGTAPISFTGDIYSGYLRNSAETKLIAREVTVTRRVTHYFREIFTTDAPASRTQMILVCDKATNHFFGSHVVAGAPSYEEIVDIGEVYSGDPENAPSVIYPCTNDHQGTVATVANRDGDRPLDEPYGILARMPALGQVLGWADVRRQILDTKAVNPPLSP
jgi:hypothetical protein